MQDVQEETLLGRTQNYVLTEVTNKTLKFCTMRKNDPYKPLYISEKTLENLIKAEFLQT
ncbi:hypothetical protein TcasGA2_TC031734 [Tribolium castaneum]|uniref:Uncharacterized protein n=1 Tax=Tribolium castaneum TaxID=7070 RepID=A0A139W8Y7_TRICA|nr:hypothetical protein TcasGA2_TC031734 [Tribolium castaneum]